MTNISSYVDYLPSFLWSQENDPSKFLGRMLCIFEKMLTGLDAQAVGASATIAYATNNKIQLTNITDAAKFRAGDIINIEGTAEWVIIDYILGTEIFLETNLTGSYDKGNICNNKYADFEKTIDELNQIFNPWKTNEAFLPWLASWVALTLQKDWSEYQKRKLISEIVSIYQERGLKKGLHTYLDIYASTEARPRISIDDGDAIFRATFLDDGTAVLHTVAHSSEVLGQSILLHPSAIATDKNNNYIIAEGDTNLSPPQQPVIWKMSSTGEIEYKLVNSQKLPRPQPFYSGAPLAKPTAVVVDKQNRLSVVDVGEITSETSLNSGIYRFNPDIETVIKNPAVHPVDMILDGSKFVVLDRGTHPIGENPGSPGKNSGQKIVVVSEGSSPVDHPLKDVIEPTALVMDSMGRYIVADAKNQAPSGPEDLLMADLVRVDLKAGSETSLLGTIPSGKNPLVFPIGLAFENSQSLLVCDSGIRWGFEGDDVNNRVMAEPAAIYRIDSSQTPPTITRVTHERKLVNPTKMMIDLKGKLIITDKGESNQDPPREWRTKANEFGVSVFFSQQRVTSNDDRNRIRRGIESVVNEQKPGHTSWWMNS
jgi:phage tail-like protein